MSQSRKDDFGATVTVTVSDANDDAIDISSATVRQFIIKKPDGTLLTKTAGFVTDGQDGKLQYTFISGDLDTQGPYHLQARVTDSSAFNYRTEIAKIEIGQILE
jgi:hypothetical protein